MLPIFMNLEQALLKLDDYPVAQLDNFSKFIDPKIIEECLQATGKASIRRRKLPAEQVIWLVIALGLFCNEPVAKVAEHLNIIFPDNKSNLLAPSALVQARDRLGKEPLEWLFKRLSEHWCNEDVSEWKGLKLFGIDGIVWRIRDTPENNIAFQRQTNATQKICGTPLIRSAALMSLGSHLIKDFAFGSYVVNEMNYANELLDSIPDDSLTIFDRGFFSADIMETLHSHGRSRHWLIPAKKNLVYSRKKVLGRQDWIVEMTVSVQARRKNPSLPETWQARLITKKINGKEIRFLTSLTDEKAFSAKKIALLYSQRWEIELGFREIKQTLLQSKPVLRSKSPEKVIQELWGVLIAYNLVRWQMSQMAIYAKVPANRISFSLVLPNIRMGLVMSATGSPGNWPKALISLFQEVKKYILPDKKPRKSYPRALKVRKDRYPMKNAGQLN